jgi:hypothetical protein
MEWKVMTSLKILSDADLLDVFLKAKQYKLEKLFIEILLAEINRRGLQVAAS